MTTQQILIACIVCIPVAFAFGRLSTRIAWFHATSEEKYTVKEFLHSNEEG